jgi:hypothetical protein
MPTETNIPANEDTGMAIVRKANSNKRQYLKIRMFPFRVRFQHPASWVQWRICLSLAKRDSKFISFLVGTGLATNSCYRIHYCQT